MDLATACPPWRQRLSTRDQLSKAGVTRSQLELALKKGVLQRVGRRTYSPLPLPPLPTHLLSGGRLSPAFLARARLALLQRGETACAEGTTAALLWGFDLAVEPRVASISVPPGGGGRVGEAVVVERDAFPMTLLPVLGFEPIRVPTAVETVLQCAATLPLAEGVVVADSALRNKAVTRREMVVGARRWHRHAGARRVRKVLSLMDARSESVLESLLRVLLVTAGIARPELQYVICDGRAFVARVDLCWPLLRLVVEGDGRRWHDPDDRRQGDRRRDNSLERLSWRVLRFTWAEVVHEPDYVVSTVRDCLRGWMAAA